MINLSKRAKNERDFFDSLAEKADIHYFWGWKTKIGKYRHNLRAQIIASHLNKKMTILELGCYVGELTKKIAKSGANIFAVDISPKSINLAKTRIKLKNVHFSVDNIEDSKFKDNFFDVVFGNGILHHTNLKLSLPEIKRILKPSGKLIFFEPNLLNPEIFLERKVPLLRELSHSSPDETAFICWQLKKTIIEAGFVNVRVDPTDFLYPAFPGQFLESLKIINQILEKTPLLREFSGSLYVWGEKPK